MNIIFQPTKSISYHNKVRWITKDASEEFDMIIGRYDKVRKINAYCNHPPVILNKIQKSIFKRMINSCNQINFNQTAPF